MARKSNSNSKSSTQSKRQNTTSTRQMKYEIANECGVELGPNTSSRQNGKVGGEVTRRLVEKGKTSTKRSSSSR